MTKQQLSTSTCLTRGRHDFERYKHVLEKLYLRQKKSRKEVSEYMKSEHGFEATKSQFEEAFRRWGWTKNIPSHVWDQVYNYVDTMPCHSKFEVFYYAEKVNDDKVHRELQKRHSRVFRETRAASLPTGVAVLLLPLDTTRILQRQTPFSQIESYLTSHHDNILRTALKHVPSYRSSLIHRQLEALFLLKPLETIAVSSKYWQTSPDTSSPGDAVQVYRSLYRQILFSVSNNFSGLNKSGVTLVMQHLATHAFPILSHTIKRASPSYTTKAIIHNLFQSAVEFGYANIVELCLQCKHGINIDDRLQTKHGAIATPIEVASSLQHCKIVKLLLKHGADVRQVYYDTDRMYGLTSAFEYALRPDMFVDPTEGFPSDDHVTGEITAKTSPEPEILEMLLDAGVELTWRSITKLLATYTHLVVSTLKKRMSTKHSYWSENGLFVEAMAKLDSAACIEVVEMCSEVGVNLNHVPKQMLYDLTWYNPIFDQHTDIPAKSPAGKMTMMDMACIKGHTEVVEFLLDHGASVTRYTIPHAIESGNKCLMHMFLRKCGSINAENTWRRSVLSKVIRLGEDGLSIFSLLIDNFILQPLIPTKFNPLELLDVCNSTVACIIQFLIQHGVIFDPVDLTCFLAKTIRDGNREAAKALIDLGVDANMDSQDQSDIKPPLYYAIERDDSELVGLLLEAEANPVGWAGVFSAGSESLLMLALRHGNRNIVQLLLDAGADPNSSDSMRGPNSEPLIAAVKKQDLELVDLLLRAGGMLNVKEIFGRSSSPLSTAAKLGDISMVGYLLKNGASFHDDEALLAAAHQSPEMVDLLLDSYNKFCPLRHIHFGASTIEYAVKRGEFYLFKHLLERGLKAQNDKGTSKPFSAILDQAIGGDLRFLEEALDQGLCPDAVVTKQRAETYTGRSKRPTAQVYSNTAFLAAISTGNVEIVKLLIRRNANINLPPRLSVKRTPLQKAAEGGHLDIVRTLIQSNADVNGAPALSGGGTAIQLAAIGGYDAIIDLLLSYGADVNAASSRTKGRTALEGAAEYGRLDTVQLLLNAGAAHDGTDLKEMKSAINFALENGHVQTAELLKDHVATKQASEIFDMERYEAEMSLIE